MDTIPNNWQLIKIKYLFDEFFGGSWGGDPVSSQITGLVKVIRVSEFEMNTLGLKDKISTIRSLNLDESSPKLVRKNDLILEKSGGGEKTAVGRVIQIDKDIKLPTVNSNFTNLCRPNNLVDPRFLVFSLNELYMRGVTKKNIKQTTGIQNLDIQGFTNEKIFIPPLKEQALISRYLDKKNQIINSLLEKLEKKIKLLKEQKTVIINQLVTKGLDPNVEMKDSGVDWIGEIPKHWKVGKLYQYSRLTSGSTPSKNKQEYWENGIIPWMTSGEINKKFIRSIDLKISKKGFANCTLEILPVGTVMIGLNGQGKTKGTAGILKTETTCNQSLCAIIPNESLNSKFLYYFLDSQYKHLRGLVGEGKREGISVSFLSRYPVLIPPQNEQKEIKKNLTLKLDNLEKISFLNQTKVERLKEYRQSLISSVVTGKIQITEDMI